ncbi:MAG: Holliday junction branch migration protein RuvA [Firmicutes bacterium]|nr:Holliday junction branch migration protein RuvA [Bacillota bacterium]
MIAFIKGPVWQIEEDGLIVACGGVGVKVFVPLKACDPLPQTGEEIFLHTHLQVREDAWQLYGFTDKEQLRLFRLLLNVSGVGAKTALALIDGVPPARFAAAVAAQDHRPLTAVSGVGKKTAERLLLELKDKYAGVAGDAAGDLPAAESPIDGDLLAALKQLGYSAVEARAFALSAMSALGGDSTPEQLLRYALKEAYKN